MKRESNEFYSANKKVDQMDNTIFLRFNGIYVRLFVEENVWLSVKDLSATFGTDTFNPEEEILEVAPCLKGEKISTYRLIRFASIDSIRKALIDSHHISAEVKEQFKIWIKSKVCTALQERVSELASILARQAQEWLQQDWGGSPKHLFFRTHLRSSPVRGCLHNGEVFIVPKDVGYALGYETELGFLKHAKGKKVFFFVPQTRKPTDSPQSKQMTGFVPLSEILKRRESLKGKAAWRKEYIDRFCNDIIPEERDRIIEEVINQAEHDCRSLFLPGIVEGDTLNNAMDCIDNLRPCGQWKKFCKLWQKFAPFVREFVYEDEMPEGEIALPDFALEKFLYLQTVANSER